METESANTKDPLLVQFTLSDDLLECLNGMLDWHLPASLYKLQ